MSGFKAKHFLTGSGVCTPKKYCISPLSPSKSVAFIVNTVEPREASSRKDALYGGKSNFGALSLLSRTLICIKVVPDLAGSPPSTAVKIS